MATARELSTNDAGANPTSNLLATLAAYFNNEDMLATMDEILLRRPDRHGNIFLGIDTTDFKLWRGRLEHYVPTKFFGPILIPTNQKVVNALLSELKSGETAPFAGNRSTDIIADLVGVDNVFAPENEDLHARHKKSFKDYISSTEKNIKVVSPIVKEWLDELQEKDIDIDGDETTYLAARIILAFLLNPKRAQNEKLIEAIGYSKQHFIDKATKIFHFGFFDHYGWAKQKITKEITRLYDSEEESFPKYLKENGFTLEQTQENILSIMMVGFENLQSSLISLLINFADHPQYRKQLQENIVERGEINFIPFTPTGLTTTFGQDFFVESLRLMPPVWLQARKNKNETREINYRTEEGQDSFTLPSATLVLIPNFQLARRLIEGDKFLPQREPNKNLPHPFSTGPNACPGRNIAYAANGVLIAELLKKELYPTVTQSPDYDPKVALKYKNFRIHLDREENLDEEQRQKLSPR